jgi:hypothetical protein
MPFLMNLAMTEGEVANPPFREQVPRLTRTVPRNQPVPSLNITSRHLVDTVSTHNQLRNIGSEQDLVDEIFGIVVKEDSRQSGLGSGLVRFLYSQLACESHFGICESRTAISAGWKVAHSNEFVPVGFEPFAHSTPAGAEPMLPTARLSSGLLGRRSVAGLCTGRAGPRLSSRRPRRYRPAFIKVSTDPRRSQLWSNSTARPLSSQYWAGQPGGSDVSEAFRG